MSEIRYDRLHDTHVLIAPERMHRPDCPVPLQADETTLPKCPFCEGNESMTPPEIFALRYEGSFPNEAGWRTRVIPNLYKAVQIEAAHQHHSGMLERWEGFGAHEVIIDTVRHCTSISQWNLNEACDWLKTLRVRVADLRHDERIEYISLFKNEGYQAGSTQTHAHTQLIALPMVPKQINDYYLQCFEHYKATGKSLMGSLIDQEEHTMERIVSQEGDFTLFCPYASAYPFEMIISSKQPHGQIDTLNDTAIEAVSALLLRAVKKLDNQLGCSQFNLWIATPPLKGKNDFSVPLDEAFRFSIRIMPRIYRYGGFESGSGMMINPVSPELAASLLKGEQV